jgi:hypothetical protein
MPITSAENAGAAASSAVIPKAAAAERLMLNLVDMRYSLHSLEGFCPPSRLVSPGRNSWRSQVFPMSLPNTAEPQSKNGHPSARIRLEKGVALLQHLSGRLPQPVIPIMTTR